MWNNWSKKRKCMPVYDAWLDKYKKELSKYKDDIILDLGAGLGANTLYLAKNGYNILAVDFSIELLNNIKENVENVEIMCFDMRNTFPIKDESINIIVADLFLY